MTERPERARFSPDRMKTLTDGVFAIAMTVMALQLAEAVVPNAGLAELWAELWPRLIAYVLSFLILGLFWAGHHFTLERLAATDRVHLWLNLVFLMFIAAIPFPAALVGSYIDEWFAIAAYGANLTLAAVALEISWWYAYHQIGLLDARTAPQRHAIERRLGIAIATYLLAIVVALWQPILGLAAFFASHLALAVMPLTRP